MSTGKEDKNQEGKEIQEMIEEADLPVVNVGNDDEKTSAQTTENNVHIIDGMEIVVNSNVEDSLQENKKVDVKGDNNTNDKEKISKKLEEIITGRMRGSSICGMISKRMSSSRS